jgi:hypothetical protein
VVERGPSATNTLLSARAMIAICVDTRKALFFTRNLHPLDFGQRILPTALVLQRLKSLAWGEDAAKLVSIMAQARGIEPWAKAYQLLINSCSAKLQKPQYICQL